MPNLPLTLACWNYDRTRPLMDGRVKPDGIDLDIKVMRPREAFPRMLEKREEATARKGKIVEALERLKQAG